ncbi:hypothetical protein [Streptomyces sp. TRM64462]|uniref:hypothetical protein n=1 Tax=Streptomyces sp. TRM64462 TaxID=2741726 RepID=UPI00158689A2|nr:hypothetical protein [Streptomyces sp. TRM64462]
MNQIGDKPEEVRRHQEEEKRQARKKGDKAADRAAEAPERDRVEGAVPDDEAYSTFDAYEEPEDRP